MMGDGGMMGDGYESDPVDGLADARDRAEEFADAMGLDLRVGEVMRFTENYYVELEEPDGTKSTEVLVDPNSGAVQLEFGPAMMWNTRYGMMGGSSSVSSLTELEVRAAAEKWVAEHDGLTLGESEAFPGYYTFHTLREGQTEGMLSVHADTGVVWYHGWHGRFLGMTDE